MQETFLVGDVPFYDHIYMCVIEYYDLQMTTKVTLELQITCYRALVQEIVFSEMTLSI